MRDTKVEGGEKLQDLFVPELEPISLSAAYRRSSAFICDPYLVVIFALGREENILAADERRSTPIKPSCDPSAFGSSRGPANLHLCVAHLMPWRRLNPTVKKMVERVLRDRIGDDREEVRRFRHAADEAGAHPRG